MGLGKGQYAKRRRRRPPGAPNATVSVLLSNGDETFQTTGAFGTDRDRVAPPPAKLGESRINMLWVVVYMTSFAYGKGTLGPTFPGATSQQERKSAKCRALSLVGTFEAGKLIDC